MRTPANFATTHSLIAVIWIVFGASSMSGCGDDDEGSTDAGLTSERAGRGGRGGERSAGTGGGPAIEPLPDRTAGKSCSDDEDCEPGNCLHSFEGAFGGAMMDAPGGYCSGTCMTDADCGGGGTCSGAFPGIANLGATAGRCLKGCTSAADCREGYRCVNGIGMAVDMPANTDAGAQDPAAGLFGASACQPLPATDKLANGIVGSACTADSECGDGRCAQSSGTAAFPDGYCTGACLRDSDCGERGSCALPLTGGAGTCNLQCDFDSNCREGYRCRDSGGVSICTPGAAPLPSGIVGRACNSDQACGGASNSCRTRIGMSAAPGGYCSLACVDNSDCGTDGLCVGGLGGAFAGLLGATGSCYRACTQSTECREGYACGAAGGFGQTSMVCAIAPPPAPGDDAGVE